MMLPVPHRPASSNDDYRELATALKLLAGFECKRDAQQAHTMLVRLTESRTAAIADDARTVLQKGLQSNWFDDKTPFYQDLQSLAGRASRSRVSDSRQQMIALSVGLLALLGGVIVFLYQSGDEDKVPLVAVAAVIIAAAMALKAMSKR